MCGTLPSKESEELESLLLKSTFKTEKLNLPIREDFESSAIQKFEFLNAPKIYSKFFDNGFRFFNTVRVTNNKNQKFQREEYLPKWAEFSIYPQVLQQKESKITKAEGSEIFGDWAFFGFYFIGLRFELLRWLFCVGFC